MDMDQLEGSAQQVDGKLEDVVGQVCGDQPLRAEGTLDEVAATAKAIFAGARDAWFEAADAATNKAEHAQGKSRKAPEAVMGHAGQAYDKGRRHLREGARSVEDRIEDHPLMGPMVAGTVGSLMYMHHSKI